MTGPASVGKTSFLQRLTEDHFTTTFGTIGVDFKIKCVKLDGESLKLQIWDTAGHERFRTITSSYYRGSMGIAVCYDIQDRRSFEDLPHWLELQTRHAPVGTPAVIIGMKADDAARREARRRGPRIRQVARHAVCRVLGQGRAQVRRARGVPVDARRAPSAARAHAERQFQITAPPPTRRRCG